MSSGTAVIDAAGPHIQTRVATVRNIATGEITMRRDNSHGCTRLASTVLSASKIAGGTRPSRTVLVVAKPSKTEHTITVVGPMTGMKFKRPKAMPQSTASLIPASEKHSAVTAASPILISDSVKR